MKNFAILFFSLLLSAVLQSCEDTNPSFPSQEPRFELNGEIKAIAEVYLKNEGGLNGGNAFTYHFLGNGLNIGGSADSLSFSGNGYHLEVRIVSKGALQVVNGDYTYALSPAPGSVHYGILRKMENGKPTSEYYSIISGVLKVNGQDQILEGSFISANQAKIEVFYDEPVVILN